MAKSKSEISLSRLMLESMSAKQPVPEGFLIQWQWLLKSVMSELTGEGGLVSLNTESLDTAISNTEEVIKGLNPAIRVFGKACPLLVPLVEEGLLHDSVTDEIASRYLQELKGKYVDTLVLGCTHYPLLRSTVARIMGSEVTLVNPAYETAQELKQILAMEGLLNPGTSGEETGTETDSTAASPHHEFYVSDLADNFRDFASSILPGQVDSTQKIEIEEY